MAKNMQPITPNAMTLYNIGFNSVGSAIANIIKQLFIIVISPNCTFLILVIPRLVIYGLFVGLSFAHLLSESNGTWPMFI